MMRQAQRQSRVDQSGVGNDYTTNSISVSAGAGNDSLFDVPNNKSQKQNLVLVDKCLKITVA